MPSFGPIASAPVAGQQSTGAVLTAADLTGGSSISTGAVSYVPPVAGVVNLAGSSMTGGSSIASGSVAALPPGQTGGQYATTVFFSVVDVTTGVPVTGLSNLDYAFYDQPRIKDALAPVKKGGNLSISGGTATIDITGLTSLAPGQTGRVEWGTADGLKAGGGQVVVS